MENFPNFVGSTALAATLSEPLVPCFGRVGLDFFAIGNFSIAGTAIPARRAQLSPV
jgi:hypothetical protein